MRCTPRPSAPAVCMICQHVMIAQPNRSRGATSDPLSRSARAPAFRVRYSRAGRTNLEPPLPRPRPPAHPRRGSGARAALDTNDSDSACALASRAAAIVAAQLNSVARSRLCVQPPRCLAVGYGPVHQEVEGFYYVLVFFRCSMPIAVPVKTPPPRLHACERWRGGQREITGRERVGAERQTRAAHTT